MPSASTDSASRIGSRSRLVINPIIYAEVSADEPVLGQALAKYIDARGVGFEKRAESKILTDAAPF